MYQKHMKISPISVTKYILYRCGFDGDVITNLKMQKLLYFVYVWHLIKLGESCFEEKFQAWPNGPVLASVYQELKQFGALPIDIDFSGIKKEEDLQSLTKELGAAKNLIDEVYEKYATLTPFQLVSLTHQETAWNNARQGLKFDEASKNELNDKDILSQYGEK